MSQPSDNGAEVVGLRPWLPWPLSAAAWWTAPVRAERLAVLRIAVALCLLIDVLTSYLPDLHTFFAAGGPGSPEFFAYYGQPPKLHWSLLRGPGDPLLSTLALVAWLSLSVWLALDLWGRWTAGNKTDPVSPGHGWLLSWLAAGIILVLGVWSRSIQAADGDLPYQVPLGISLLALAFFVLDLGDTRRRQRGDRRCWWLLACAILLGALAALGACLPLEQWRAETDELSLGHRLLRPWQEDNTLLAIALWGWVLSVVLLLVGLCTRAAAISTWVLSMSFDYVNPYINNAGDTIRVILLFYLMLCPCAALWSVDACLKKWRGRRAPLPSPAPASCGPTSGPVYVWPWPLRLLFVQMVLIYFMNGLYKLTGPDWLEGQSLYYVLGDVTLTRVSYAQFPVPLWLTQIMTWTVLVWEVSFPLLVAVRWIRPWALGFGAAFHLGIFATMELGGFVPYMLCMYVPLLPWERWLEKNRPRVA